ncbi:MAG TPA: hypothetical protein DEQ62_04115 [Verrucomicrobiales bacterium]|nr:hypothetical protein [Verrucomicrobiales bacterium]|tara:strand:+ start:1418 stop:2770 length:1353 start_codon:yes stop_codon:yes gene_type:complete
MEAPPTTVQKPATTQDAVLGLAPSTRSAGDAEQFDKIFEDASQKMKTEEEDTAKRSEEDEEQNTRKKDNAPKKHKEVEASEALTGLVRATELQKQTAKKVIKAEAVQKQEVATPTEVQPKLKKVESKQTTETTQEAKAQAALKRQQQRTATRARNRVQEFQQLTKADQAKADQVREQNTLSKPATQQPNPVLKEMVSQSVAKDGTQVAPKTDNMTMPSKPLAPKLEAKPVLVEELRPATGAAETSPRSGQQSAQQDLPKETPKETILPVTSVQSATPAVSGVTPAQAATAPQGALNPILEKIWDAVTTFRVRGENEMTVKVQPDNDTEMQLTIKYGAGGVEIEARMHQGDGRQLASGWNELQQQLSERGVNLGDLASEDSEENTRDSDPRQFNRQGQPQSHPTEFQIGDEEADWAALGMAVTRDKEPTRTTAPESTDKVEEAYDGWQSWA